MLKRASLLLPRPLQIPPPLMSSSSLRLVTMLSARALRQVFDTFSYPYRLTFFVRPREKWHWQCHVDVRVLLNLKTTARAKKPLRRRTQSAMTTAQSVWHISCSFVAAGMCIWILSTLMTSKSKIRGITLRRLFVCLHLFLSPMLMRSGPNLQTIALHLLSNHQHHQ